MIDRARAHRALDELLDALGAPPPRAASLKQKPLKVGRRRPRVPYQPENPPSELDAARAKAVGRRLGIIRP